jgi:HSP20 family protein
MKFGLTRKNNNSNLPDVRSFKDRMDRIFDEFFSLSPVDFFDSQWLPAIDMYDDEKNVYIKADVAGIDEKDLNVSIQDNILTISGERIEEKQDKRKGWVISERSMGSFCRSVNLPAGIKHDSIKAELKNGVLTVTLPKEKQSESKTIKINVK